MVGSRHTPLRIALKRPWPTTRRGLCLWLFAVAFIWIGAINYIGTDLPPLTKEALSFPLDIAPAWFWGCVMIASACLAVWSSYCHMGRDRYGFVTLATFCTGWGLCYWCGFLFYDASLRAVAGSITWLLFAGILTLLSGFPNAPFKLHKKLEED